MTARPAGDPRENQGAADLAEPSAVGSDLPLLTAAGVTQVLSERDLNPTKGLGQNFVADPNTIRKIVRLAGVRPGDEVVEIGPGLGSLTRGLLTAGATVTAIERDRHLIPLLRESLPAVRLIEGDALEFDWVGTFGERSVDLVANLPYNVAATLVLTVLDVAPMVQRQTVMVQREVGERLCAGPGSKLFGIPSVKLATVATAQILAPISRDVFVPKPRVDSVLIRVVRQRGPLPGPIRSALDELLATGFGQRRKMVRATIGRRYGADLLAAAAVDPQLRPEQLDVDLWLRLAEGLAKSRDGVPPVP
jgi:16S rRNA (adenine1518-N6/adenine1519-N6)-dimethyltransferase